MRWFNNAETVGICGATSTPKWLMEECREYLRKRETHGTHPSRLNSR